MKMETLLSAGTKTHAAEQDLASGKAHIDILKTLFLNGPSIWAYRPVLEAWVDIGALEERPSDTIPGLYERLCSWLPDLVEHRCGAGERGGFLHRLREGTWAGHIIEHVMIELQMQAGIPTGFGRARETSQRGIYRVVVRTPDEKVGLAALHAARDLLIAAIDGGGAFNVKETILHLRNVALERGLDAGTLCLLGAAAERRIPLMRLNDSGLMQLGYGRRQRRIWMNKVPQGGAIAQSIADDPLLARSLLQSCGIPVPYMALAESVEEAWALRQDREVPLEITPVNAEGTTAARQAADTREQIETAYQAASADDDEVLVQDFVAGNGYRLLVIGNRIAAAQCHPAGGESATLVDAASVHPEVGALASLAVRVVGLDIAEVRMVANDISQPLSAQNACNAYVTRINPMPDLLQYGTGEQDRLDQLGLEIVDHLAAKVEEEQLPIIAVSGSKGRTAVAQLVALLLQDKYKKIGMACADGLYIGARRVESGNQAGRDTAQRVLRNPAIDAAVFEHGWQDIVAEGLGYERCRIGIVTGWDTQDTMPEYDINNAEQMRKVIRTPIDVVLPDGAAVLNADDPAVASLAGLCDGEVIFFSRDGQAPFLSRHRTKGGSAVFMRNKDMVFAVGRHTIAIELDLTQAHGQSVDNMLAAAAAAWALGVPAAAICNTLKKVNEQLSPVSPTAIIAE